MKKYFGYTRVSTTKQGEQGSSLQEQQAAIEAYAKRHGLKIAEWFEELETAASQVRPIFGRILKAIERKQADGVTMHKIDRSDWARIGGKVAVERGDADVGRACNLLQAGGCAILGKGAFRRVDQSDPVARAVGAWSPGWLGRGRPGSGQRWLLRGWGSRPINSRTIRRCHQL
jgi:hypothetical protein